MVICWKESQKAGLCDSLGLHLVLTLCVVRFRVITRVEVWYRIRVLVDVRYQVRV